MIAIPLRSRDGRIVGHTMVDDDDAQFALAFTWRLTGGYATRRSGGRRIRLHRAICGLSDYTSDRREVDHVNRDRLDNRRANLRVCTHAENLQNVPSQQGTSGHRGVSWHARDQRWRAQVRVDGRAHHLGYFQTEAEAAEAAAAFRALHMPFAEEGVHA